MDKPDPDIHAQTLTRFQQGDKAAFAELIRHYQKPLFAYLGRMGLSQAIAEEIAQDAFIRTWQARQRFDCKRSQFSTWLFTITRRLALNELDRHAHHYEINTSDHGLEAHVNNTANPEQHLAHSEMQQQLQQALCQLNIHERSLLALAYLQDLELQHIAAIEDIPVGTVKSRLYRIRQRLKRHMNSAHGEDSQHA